MRNGYVKFFNGRMRDELLNESLFLDLDQARQLIGGWVTDYNTARPHSSLGYKTPAAYAATLTAPNGIRNIGRDSDRHWMKIQWQVSVTSEVVYRFVILLRVQQRVVADGIVWVVMQVGDMKDAD